MGGVAAAGRKGGGAIGGPTLYSVWGGLVEGLRPGKKALFEGRGDGEDDSLRHRIKKTWRSHAANGGRTSVGKGAHIREVLRNGCRPPRGPKRRQATPKKAAGRIGGLAGDGPPWRKSVSGLFLLSCFSKAFGNIAFFAKALRAKNCTNGKPIGEKNPAGTRLLGARLGGRSTRSSRGASPLGGRAG